MEKICTELMDVLHSFEKRKLQFCFFLKNLFQYLWWTQATHDGQGSRPGVWHKLPTGELKHSKIFGLQLVNKNTMAFGLKVTMINDLGRVLYLIMHGC